MKTVDQLLNQISHETQFSSQIFCFLLAHKCLMNYISFFHPLRKHFERRWWIMNFSQKVNSFEILFSALTHIPPLRSSLDSLFCSFSYLSLFSLHFSLSLFFLLINKCFKWIFIYSPWFLTTFNHHHQLSVEKKNMRKEKFFHFSWASVNELFLERKNHKREEEEPEKRKEKFKREKKYFN